MSAGRPHGHNTTPHTAVLGAERHFEGAAPSSSTTIDTMPTGAVCGSSYVPIRGGGIFGRRIQRRELDHMVLGHTAVEEGIDV